MNQKYLVYKLKVGFGQIINFTYIVIDLKTKKIVIIDPAWEMAKIESLLQMLKGQLTTILLTHFHFDHTNLVTTLLKKYNPKVFMSAKEIFFYNFQCSNLNGFNHDDIIEIGETQVICLLTPGHTFGSTCYLLPDSLFTGDTIFIEGCGLSDIIGATPEMMFESIQNIKNTVDHKVKVFPGHSYGKEPGYPLEYLLKNNIYFQFDTKEKFAEFRMRKGQKNLFKFC